METIQTRNKKWGFYGTINTGDAGATFNAAAQALVEVFGFHVGKARNLLDSRLGRHIADQRLDGESGKDLIARLAKNRGWAADIRRLAGVAQPATIKLVVERAEIPILRLALDHALSSISEAHAEDRAQIKALIERLEAAQR